jgi:hypothetical protein
LLISCVMLLMSITCGVVTAQTVNPGSGTRTTEEPTQTIGLREATTQNDSVQRIGSAIPVVSNENRSVACPPPQTGSITETRTVTNTNGVSRYSAWTEVSRTCAMPAVITYVNENRSLACPAPQIGSISQVRTVTLTNGVPTAWSSWSTTSNTCASAPVITYTTETQTLACPPPQTGSIVQSRTVTRTNGVATAWAAWTTTSNTCTVAPVYTTSTENQSYPCPPPQTGTIFESRTLYYTNGVLTSIGGWTSAGNTCAVPAPVITTNTEYQNFACPPGWVGSGTSQQRTVTYVNGAMSSVTPWVTTNYDCTVVPPPPPAWSSYQMACFTAGTPVTMADGSEKAIEKVEVGELVKTYDETTKKFTVSPVTDALHHEKAVATLVDLTLSTGKVITANTIHRILVNDEYASAGEIAKRFIDGKPIRLTGVDGKHVGLDAAHIYKREVPLYNLHVKSPYDTEKESELGHNYIAQGIVVHNEKADSTIDAWVDSGGYGEAALCESRGGGVWVNYGYPRSVWCIF